MMNQPHPNQHDEPQDEPAEAVPEPELVASPQDEAVDVGALEAELAETKERLLRALADTENLRRRTARELDEARKYSVTGFARELLEVADNLSRALESIPKEAREQDDLVKTLVAGVEMTQRTLANSFERHQIVKLAPEIGERFDHNRHQAMFETEAAQEPGTIAQVLQPGYLIADRLLRPALVGVAKRPANQAAGNDGPAPDAGHQRPGEYYDTTA